MVIKRPLDAEEELLWRALLRVVVALPRVLDEDLRPTGLTLTDYAVLMNLSEAAGRRLSMSDLALAVGLSASRITRVVASLQKLGLVTKARCAWDGRSNIATLTADGLTRLQGAYPTHLASARARVIDRFASAAVSGLGEPLSDLAESLTSPETDA